jgi:hypothetical protein
MIIAAPDSPVTDMSFAVMRAMEVLARATTSMLT